MENNLWAKDTTADPREIFAEWLPRHGWPEVNSPEYDKGLSFYAAIDAYAEYRWEWEPSLPLLETL